MADRQAALPNYLIFAAQSKRTTPLRGSQAESTTNPDVNEPMHEPSLVHILLLLCNQARAPHYTTVRPMRNHMHICCAKVKAPLHIDSLPGHLIGSVPGLKSRSITFRHCRGCIPRI